MAFNKFVEWNWAEKEPKAFCQFCGKKLKVYRRDVSSYSASACDCEDYQKAKDAEQQAKIAEKAEEAAELAKTINGQEVSSKKQTKTAISAVEMVLIVSGLMVSGYDSAMIKNKVTAAFQNTKWYSDDAKICLLAFAKSHVFVEELEEAACQYIGYVATEHPDFGMIDTAAKAEEIALECGLPDYINI